MELFLYLYKKIENFITDKSVRSFYKLIVLLSMFLICFLLNDCIGFTRYLTNDLEFDQIERISNLKNEYKESDEVYKYLETKEKLITNYTPLVKSFIDKVKGTISDLEVDTFSNALYTFVVAIPFLLFAIFFIISIIIIFYSKYDVWVKFASLIILITLIFVDFFLWNCFKNICDSIAIIHINAKSIIIILIEIALCLTINYYFKHNRKKLNENQ